MTQGNNILNPEAILAMLTWAAFFAVMFILQKYAWKPILAGLKKREDYIRKSLEDADKVNAELAKIESARQQILEEAKEKGNTIIELSRKAGNDLAGQIEARAKKNADEIINSARQEIEGERERVRNALRKESAQTAVALAEKILRENMDNEKNRNLIDQAMKDV